MEVEESDDDDPVRPGAYSEIDHHRLIRVESLCTLVVVCKMGVDVLSSQSRSTTLTLWFRRLGMALAVSTVGILLLLGIDLGVWFVRAKEAKKKMQ